MPDLLGRLLGPDPAMAQQPGGSAAFMTSFAPFVLIFVLFYFLLIRPQQKRQKDHKALLAGLKKGDKIVTNGGILGTVTAAGKEVLTVQVADNVRLKVLRAEVLGTQEELAGVAAGKGAKAGKGEKAEPADAAETEESTDKETKG
jgi:preprotein translocase subunit YajC